MNVGICRVTFRLPGNHSLKGKRHSARSLIERVQHRFNISIAEVEHQDKWQLLTLGLCCVSNDGRHVNAVLSTIIDYMGQHQGDTELLDYEIEIVNAL